MADINTLPQGLLGFLGLKNGGVYPRQLRDDLHPVWDLELLYTSANSLFRNDTISVTAVGAFQGPIVPDGEAWLVLNQDATSVTLGAGMSLQLALQFTNDAATVTMACSMPGNLATVGQRARVALDRPYFVGPGTRLGCLATVWAAGPMNVDVSTRYARFQL